ISNAKASVISELTGKITGKKDSTAAAGVETMKMQAQEKVQEQQKAVEQKAQQETKKIEEKAKDKLKKLFGK
ncbi:MAG: hypothetical protein HGB19_11940, partial [Chlorobiales bacterium]|nr:hypothetical protein [Chlorobiales bacterium]